MKLSLEKVQTKSDVETFIMVEFHSGKNNQNLVNLINWEVNKCKDSNMVTSFLNSLKSVVQDIFHATEYVLDCEKDGSLDHMSAEKKSATVFNQKTENTMALLIKSDVLDKNKDKIS